MQNKYSLINSKGNSTMIHITVDPGVSGALAVMFEDGKTTAYNYPGTTKETVEILEEIYREKRLNM